MSLVFFQHVSTPGCSKRYIFRRTGQLHGSHGHFYRRCLDRCFAASLEAVSMQCQTSIHKSNQGISLASCSMLQWLLGRRGDGVATFVLRWFRMNVDQCPCPHRCFFHVCKQFGFLITHCASVLILVYFIPMVSNGRDSLLSHTHDVLQLLFVTGSRSRSLVQCNSHRS